MSFQIQIAQGDITKQKDVEAIVNAANNSLLGGGGVDGAIHRAAGPELLSECRTLQGCKTGEAKITRAYRNCLQTAADCGIRTIAFPSNSTGAYRYPLTEAAEIAVGTVKAFSLEHPEVFDYVRFVLFDERTYDVYDQMVMKAGV